MRTFFLVVLWLLLYALPAHAEPRFALVIGNGAYGKKGALPNPLRDAHLMSTSLQRVGFDVIAANDATRSGMKNAIRQFTDRISQAKSENPTTLLFYAGHGVQVNGRNYMLPVDISVDSPTTLEMDAIDVDQVMRMINDAGGHVIILVLDACRDNPFPSGTRSINRGLARMDAPVGSFISYATAPGSVAQDGAGTLNSPFTKALAEEIIVPGISIEKVFRNVRNKVMKMTNKEQIPWEASSLTGEDFYFLRESATASRVVSNDEKERIRWNLVRTSTVNRDLQDFLAEYPNGVFADIARERLATLQEPVEPRGPHGTVSEKQVAVSESPSEYYVVALATAGFTEPDSKSERIVRFAQDVIVLGIRLEKGWVMVQQEQGTPVSYVPEEVLRKISNKQAAIKWKEIRNSDDEGAFQAFAETYPQEFLATRARSLARYFQERKAQGRKEFFDSLIGKKKNNM
ncbi:MAG: caspase family protein [Magnetococcales bacterium]|nr:caspase family protein [Magnetococcales bacterium]